ncbi:glycosyltransferase [Acinetobacter johnsonii]|uniref:glycosyltransferase n=1 Tax=Acinetobacter johnsonii TaxID=40214 RepID=UPI00244D4AA6|nr:glycosyltransferase [Acinetobacter johnsonii]MDH1365256.1 glycosyltransferase [Acinetobacter johnsonii]
MEKNNQPLVSIVIPCYNHEQFVQDCIQSVIDQTYENIELIIIDDGSKDHSVESIQKMVPKCDERFIRFEFRSRPNKGLSATLNEAIKWCKGNYFSIIASDDIMLEKKTAIQVDFLEKNLDTVALFGSADYIDENNNIKSQNSLKEKEYLFDKIFLNECAFFAPTQMLRMNTLLKIGGFDEKILVEDWYMWLKMAEEGRVYCLSNVLALYRIHSENSTRNSKFIYENNLKTLSLYKDHPLYKKSYAKIRWIYIIWTGQNNRIESLKLLYEYVRSEPLVVFSKFSLVYCKYFFVKIKNWY